MQTEILNIEGMTCEACVGHITKALQGLPGVQSAQVSLADKQAIITYDPTKVQAPQMVETVEEEGYEASPRV